MPDITITLSAAEYEGLAAAAAFHKADSPEAYLATVMGSACESYRKQHVIESVPMLKTKLAAVEDEKAAIAAQLDAQKAKTAAEEK